MEIKGYVRDTFRDEEGNIVYQSDWDSNVACIGLRTLTCALIKQEASYLGNFWVANGGGEVAWDFNPPTAAATTTQLVAEMARKQVASIDYLDSGDLVSATPTDKLKFSVTFELAESNGDIREFGLFGGQATAASNTGLLMDYKINAKITKDITKTLTRELKFHITNIA